MFVYFDFETTGLNPFHNKIIEYCFIDSTNKQLQSLINPGVEITDVIYNITKISNDMLKDKPSISNKKNDIIEFLNMCNTECVYLVAHNNNNFDRFFFKNIFKGDAVWEPILNEKIKYIDSIHLAKYLMPYQKMFNLKALCKYYSIVPGTHRAIDDTIALKKLFEKLVYILSQKEKIDYETLITNPKLIYNIIY